MKAAVVTGATGFLGPRAVAALRRRFPELPLRCVVRGTSKRERIADPHVSFAVADLRDVHALGEAFVGADTLVNLASLGFDWSESVVQAAQRAGIRRAVFVSTTAILTKLPVASKPVRARAEELIRASGLDWTILRPTMIYGTPEDRNIARLIKFVDRSPVVPLPARGALQQPIHVDDVAAAVAAALATPETVHRIYNISGATPLTLEALVQEVADALGRRPVLVPIPLAPIVRMLALWQRFARPPLKPEQVQRIAEHKHFDHAEAARDFGYAPRDFRSGVRAEVAMMRARQ